MRDWMWTGEVAQELGVHVSTVRYWIKHRYCRAGRMPSGRWIVPRREVERLRTTTRTNRWHEAARIRGKARPTLCPTCFASDDTPGALENCPDPWHEGKS